jgi:hypothetical protein
MTGERQPHGRTRKQAMIESMGHIGDDSLVVRWLAKHLEERSQWILNHADPYRFNEPNNTVDALAWRR